LAVGGRKIRSTKDWNYWGILVGLGWILSGFAPNLPVLCITYGVIAGAGVGLCYGVPIAVSTKWFPDRKGLAVGLTVGGFGLSAAIVSPLGNSLINSHGILGSFQILGLAFLVITVLLSLTMKFPAANWIPAGWKDHKAGYTVAQSFNPKQMMKTRSFIALFLCYVFAVRRDLWQLVSVRLWDGCNRHSFGNCSNAGRCIRRL